MALNSVSFPQIDSTTVDQFLAAALTEILCQCKQLPSVAGHVGDRSSSSSNAEDSGSPTHRDHGEPCSGIGDRLHTSCPLCLHIKI